MKQSVLSALFLITTGLSAHECWLQPTSFTPAAGATTHLMLKVGMNLQGEPRTFTPQRVASLRHFSDVGKDDWTTRVNGEAELPMTFVRPGTQVLAFDSAASLITLESEKFHAYLKEEGLERVIALREQAGEVAKPGRERYLRCNKSILQVGGLSDRTWSVRTGQKLELVPLVNPAEVRPGGTLRLVLLLKGKPLPEALVRLWHRLGDKLTVLDARTGANGDVSVVLPAAGMWMASVVHMDRTDADAEVDWESLWGNLTFSIVAG